MKATRIFLSSGEALTVEFGPDRCWHSEEICAVDVEFDDKWQCDICGEVYKSLDESDYEEETDEE